MKQQQKKIKAKCFLVILNYVRKINFGRQNHKDDEDTTSSAKQTLRGGNRSQRHRFFVCWNVILTVNHVYPVVLRGKSGLEGNGFVRL